MKLIVFPKIFATEGNKNASAAFDKGARAALALHTLADTALLKRSMPFFIPDFAPQCTATLTCVLRISRQGRTVAPRFAHRYIDAVGAGVLFTAQPLLSELQAAGLPWDAATGFDGACAMGDLLDLPAADEPLDVDAVPPLRLDVGGQAVQTLRLRDTAVPLCDLVALASRFYILRQGDYLLLPSPMATDVHIDDRITAFVGTACLTQFNVK